MCLGVDSPVSVVDEGPFSRGGWLHSHPKKEREEGGAGEKWQIIFKKSDVFGFFLLTSEWVHLLFLEFTTIKTVQLY